MEKGLTWTTSRLDVRDYTDYWRGRIHTLANFSRDEWERELQRLVQARVFAPDDLDQFARDFTDTNRQEASPRPGLSLTRQWPLEKAAEPDFPGSLRSALITALAALGEHRSLLTLKADKTVS